MNDNISNLEKTIKYINENVNRMIYLLDSFSVSYTKWVEYYLEYRVLKRYCEYGQKFSDLAKELGHALLSADVSCTREEEVSYNEWCKSLSEDFGYSRKIEIK